jgi:hypothetical protein
MSGGEKKGEEWVDGDLFDGEFFVCLDLDFAGFLLGLLLDKGGLERGRLDGSGE